MIDTHFIFRLFVVFCVAYLFAEFIILINSNGDYVKDKNARDIHLNTTKDKSPSNHGGY